MVSRLQTLSCKICQSVRNFGTSNLIPSHPGVSSFRTGEVLNAMLPSAMGKPNDQSGNRWNGSRRAFVGPLQSVVNQSTSLVRWILCARWYRAAFLFVSLFFVRGAFGQDLAPRAYLITPLHSNAVTLTYSFENGSIMVDGAAPITGASARVNIPAVSAYHSFNFFGRSASLLVGLPYGVGNFHGEVAEAEANAYRSGLLPVIVRLSVNLKGGPSMPVEEFRKWKQKTIVGVSLKVVPRSGQYDPTKLVNYGTNRWAFKPEIGCSRRWGHWILDGYGAAWFYSTNPDFFSHNQFFPGINTQSQSPIGAFEGHVSYDFKPRLWASLDGNYWFGGSTSLNGVPTPATRQSNSRVGVTASVPVSKHQSLKFSFSDGAYVRYGGNYRNFSVGWQYSWLGRPN
jgi:Putative MetA-pathway of phenol degradation